jgi:hypothetical protein
MNNDIVNKLVDVFKKPHIVIIGDEFFLFSKVINKLLDRFKLIKLKLEKIDKIKPLLKKSPILVIDYVETLKNASQIKDLSKYIKPQTYLILNYDDERIKDLKSSAVYSLTYGFSKKADLYISDISIDEEGINFKINYQGSSIPFWFKGFLSKKQMYSLLAGIAVGLVQEFNLVKLSQILSEK